MNLLKSYLEAIDYKITGGSEYGWNCFGENARYLDCADSESSDGTYSVHAIFDSVTQEVYAMEAWDYTNDREYRWINPDFVQAHKDEADSRDFDHEESFDGRKFIELEVEEDILEKITAIVAGADYDTRVKVPLNLPDDVLFGLMKQAHERDLTLNQLMEEVLLEAIEREKFCRAIDNQKELVESLEESSKPSLAMMTAKKRKKSKK